MALGAEFTVSREAPVPFVTLQNLRPLPTAVRKSPNVFGRRVVIAKVVVSADSLSKLPSISTAALCPEDDDLSWIIFRTFSLNLRKVLRFFGYFLRCDIPTKEFDSHAAVVVV